MPRASSERIPLDGQNLGDELVPAAQGVCAAIDEARWASLPPYLRNTLSKRPICSVTILIACSLVSGLAIGAPASIAASCRTASARDLRVSANKSIGSIRVLPVPCIQHSTDLSADCLDTAKEFRSGILVQYGA